MDLVAACDPDLDRARAAAPRAYASAEKMLDSERLDFVDIATRPDTHLELARLAFTRKLAVICQKPMAPTLESSVTMAREAEAARVRLMIHENWRFQPWYRVVRTCILRGDLGDPLTYCFRIRKNDGAGAEPYRLQPYFRQMPRLLFYETMIHPVDTARFLFGEIASVFAVKRQINPRIAGEDCGTILLTHTDNLSGIADGHRFMDLTADSPCLGDAFFEGTDGWLQVIASGDVFGDGKLVWQNTANEGYRGDSVLATQRHFIDCVRTGEEFETGARDYLRSYAAIEAAYQSAASGRAVTIDEVLRVETDHP